MILTGSLENPLEDYGAATDEERAVLDSLMEVIDRAGMRGEVSMFAVRGQRALAAPTAISRSGAPSSRSPRSTSRSAGPAGGDGRGPPAVVTKFGGPSESMREGDEEYGILVDPQTPRTSAPACTP